MSNYFFLFLFFQISMNACSLKYFNVLHPCFVMTLLIVMSVLAVSMVTKVLNVKKASMSVSLAFVSMVPAALMGPIHMIMSVPVLLTLGVC